MDQLIRKCSSPVVSSSSQVCRARLATVMQSRRESTLIVLRDGTEGPLSGSLDDEVFIS
jgi:hypothetical protein